MKPFPCALWKTCAVVALLAGAATPALAQTRADNPFSGARMYVNPDYTANANAAAASQSGTLATNMRTVGQQPTAVWMDRIAAVPSLATHLDNAVAQGATLFLGVVYDLPGRDCAALASNGELPATAEGLARYKTEYIDPIAAIARQSKYANLRIVFVVEPDSLPNLVTNLSDPECSAANSSGIYMQGVQYAVNTLRAIPNVYLYIDAAHSGWLGWSSNSGPFVSLMNTLASGFTGGKGAIEGFVNDTANTLPLNEPYMTATQTVGGQQVMSANFYQYNPNIDEASYVADMWSRFSQGGWPSTMAFITDSSRNGWGGSQRPTAASTSTDLNTFVNASKVDRRAHRGLWCNPSGAGVGERPRASPGIAHVDAFVWVKPPGESDGASSDIPNDQGKKFDRMCDPTYTTQYGVLTGALPNAPLSGQFFTAQFTQLVQNAFPALSGGGGGTGPFTLTVAKAGTGSGTVTSNTGGISCGTVCSASFASGTNVTLTATAATGSTFASWAGCTSTSGSTCTVSMTAARTVTATFNSSGGGTTFALTVAKAGTGSGTVTSSTGGINCGSVCSANLASGTTVTLTAAAATGSTFAGWSGACTGTSCVLSMTAARAVTATFNTSGGGTTFALTVAKAGTGSGTVTSSTGGINCGSVCSANLASGTTVTLTATAATGSTFAGWSGACTGTTCVLSMTAARSVTATFNTTGGGGGGGTGSCTNAITFSWNTGNFNTTGAVCYRANQDIHGWGCSNMEGRTVSVNGGAATTTCGGGALAKSSDGYTYFAASAGQFPWASIYVW